MYLTTCITYFSVTLLSSEPEVQYVALRNINLIVQKRYIVQFRYWCMCDVRFCRHVVQTNLKIISVLISTINKWFSLYLLLLSGSFCCLSCHLWPECQANLPFPLLFDLLHVWHCCFVLFFLRADILKNEMKVFFVKYNDPIYVKLEKLDIMIRLANQQNIAQVLAELKE